MELYAARSDPGVDADDPAVTTCQASIEYLGSSASVSADIIVILTDSDPGFDVVVDTLNQRTLLPPTWLLTLTVVVFGSLVFEKC